MKIVAVALSLSLCIAALTVLLGGVSDPFTEIAGTISRPVQAVGRFVDQNVSHIYGQAAHYETLLQENEALKDELARLQKTEREAQSALRENARLRELLELRRVRQDLKLETARVLNRSATNWSRSLTIDKGSADGVALGNCVIDSRGALVGLVREVGRHRAHVFLINDAAFELGGEGADCAEWGILEGDFTLMGQGKLRLGYLEKDSKLAAGEEVLTFASEGVYPSGLLVGTVEEVALDPTGMNRYATIAPAADLEDLYQVFIIKDFTIEN